MPHIGKINLVGTMEIDLRWIPMAPHLLGKDPLRCLIKAQGVNSRVISKSKIQFK